MAEFNYLETSDLCYALNLRTGAGIEIDFEEQFADPKDLSTDGLVLWIKHFVNYTGE